MATVNEIVNVQRLLNLAGESLTVDGVLGSLTIQAIKRFQDSHGMLPTGLIDKELISSLNSEINNPTSTENFFMKHKSAIIMSMSIGILLYGVHFIGNLRNKPN